MNKITKLMSKTAMKSFEDRMKYISSEKPTLHEYIYDMVLHAHNKVCADMVVKETKDCTIKQFAKYDFTKLLKKQKTTLNKNRVTAIIELQNQLNLYMKTLKASTPVAKKKTAKKVVAKKVKAKKVKPVAKKKTTKQTILDKYTKQYKIVTQYSDNLLQDVYSVVYKGQTIKRFVNENLANKYIGQEVLVKVGEHNIRTAKKTKALNAELNAEFEG